MKKRNIIFIVFAIFAIGVYFGLQKKRQVVISNQEAVDNSQETISSEQETESNSQKTIENNQETVISEQGTESKSNEQQAVISNQKSVTSEKEIITAVDQKTEVKNVEAGKIVLRLVSWGFQKTTGRKIDTLIIHTSYNALGGDEFDRDQVIQEWKDAGVAPHYMIARDGTVYQLVAKQNIALHAGVAKTPDGSTDVNSFSLGIEIINTKDGKFTSAQYDALNRLIGDLKQKYTIKYILGHSDIAPGRKTDPWGIDWSKVSR